MPLKRFNKDAHGYKRAISWRQRILGNSGPMVLDFFPEVH
jgi:hypothetical protein